MMVLEPLSPIMNTVPRFVIGISIAVFALSWAQEGTHPRYVKMTDHDPDGIGISYMGREIAQVMGHEAADWLDRPEREIEEAPSILVKSLQLKSGMAIADIGAGSGYLSFLMAKRVGSNGSPAVGFQHFDETGLGLGLDGPAFLIRAQAQIAAGH